MSFTTSAPAHLHAAAASPTVDSFQLRSAFGDNQVIYRQFARFMRKLKMESLRQQILNLNRPHRV